LSRPTLAGDGTVMGGPFAPAAGEPVGVPPTSVFTRRGGGVGGSAGSGAPASTGSGSTHSSSTTSGAFSGGSAAPP